MKLYYNQASPYARKARVVVAETGLENRVDLVDCGLFTPVAPHSDVVASNPIGKIPTLIDGDGIAIYDSRVICELLDSAHDSPRLCPDGGTDRWRVLTRQALADGLLDAALLVRYEQFLRPEECRWGEWIDQQWQKVRRALDAMESDVPESRAPFDIGRIAVACALGYLDFRFADDGWRARCPGLAAWFAEVENRPSMRTTIPG